MDYAYKITTHGRAVLAACMDMSQPLKLTRAAVGRGLIDKAADLATQHALVQYAAEATIADRRHEGDHLYLTVRYSNADAPEVGAFSLSEIMVWAEDPETGAETDLLYGTLGDYRQPVPAYSDTQPPAVFSYPLVLVVSGELEVTVTAAPGIVLFDDLKAGNIAYDPGASGLAARSVQEALDEIALGTLRQTAVPERTVEVAAEDLPDYIASLPRLINEALTINVSGTMNDEIVTFSDFYGSGIIVIDGGNNADLHRATIDHCNLAVSLKNTTFKSISNTSNATEGIIHVNASKHVYIGNCIIDGRERTNSIGFRGVYASSSSYVFLNVTSIKNCQTAVFASSATSVTIYGTGAEFSDNSIGARVYHGGFVYIVSAGTPDTLGANANMKEGGFIIKNSTFL